MRNVELHQKLSDFLERWPLEKVKEMTLPEYAAVGDKDTFTYWVEFECKNLGVISGTPANKFGIWRKNNDREYTSMDFYYTDEYAWYKKYGEDENEAFATVKALVIEIIENATAKNFRAIDAIDYHSLAKWKIAFLYSDYSLMPIYKNATIRKIARHFEHSNYEKARLSDLHTFIVNQKPIEEDFFDFARKQYEIAENSFERNYYIIGSKYENDNGGGFVSILDSMLERNIIAAGYFWGTDFTRLYRHSQQEIQKWCDDNIIDKSGKYGAAKRTLSIFLQLRPGDIIAVKSHGQYGDLTIVAYAVVKEVEGKVYEPDGGDFPESLGHIVHVDFLETNLWIETKLSYGQTIHQIIPGEREGHFEKIFGSFASLEDTNDTLTGENTVTLDAFEDIIEEDRINEKQTEPTYREVSYSTVVSRTHNKIQIAFAKHLKRLFPSDVVRTETNNIDIKRENNNEIFYYEVKPYNSAYSCIRAGIGQLLDYCHSNPGKGKAVHLVIVGHAEASSSDLKFIEFIKGNLNIPFDYIAFNHLTEA